MKNNGQKIREIAFNLDSDVASAAAIIDVLYGANEFLYDLKEDVDEAAHLGHKVVPTSQIQRKVASIYELLNYVLGDLAIEEDRIRKNKDQLISIVSGERDE